MSTGEENEIRPTPLCGLGPEDAIADWASEVPGAIAIFEKHGIDYCCGGRSFEYACEDQEISPVHVIIEIAAQLPEELDD